MAEDEPAEVVFLEQRMHHCIADKEESVSHRRIQAELGDFFADELRRADQHWGVTEPSVVQQEDGSGDQEAESGAQEDAVEARPLWPRQALLQEPNHN